MPPVGGNLGFNPGAWWWEPPGVPSNPADTNVVPNGNGTAGIYPPGEPAPTEANTFSYPNWFIPGIGPVRGTAADVGAKYGGAVPGGGGTAGAHLDQQAQAWAEERARIYNDWLSAMQAEDTRRFGVTEQRLSAADRAAADRARAQTAATEAGVAATRQSAFERLAFERQSARERLAFEQQSLGQTTADRERSQRVALAQALLSLSTGPNGPANRRMALALLSGLGVNTAGGEGGGGGSMQSPNLIPPVLWDALPPGAKTLLMDAWQAQGGNPGDFQFAINNQRPQGQPSAPAQVRYAAPVGM